MKEQLIRLLQRDEDGIADAWTERLSETARLAGQRLGGHALTPVRLMMHDLVRVLEGKSVQLTEGLSQARTLSLDGAPSWQVNLCYAVEVLLTGEVVIRNWAYVNLDLTDRQQVEAFELINRGFHELLRSYTLQYCQACHEVLAGDSGPG